MDTYLDPDLIREPDDTVAADPPTPAAESDPPAANPPEAGPAETEQAPTGIAEVTLLTAYTGRRRRFGTRWIERGIAAVLVLAFAAVAFHFYRQDRDRELVDAARQSAQDAACAYAPVLATYDAKTFQDYVAKALAGATGKFKSQFADASKSLGDVMNSADVSSTGSDANCELKSGDRDSARVAVVVNQTIVAAGTQGKPVNGQLSMMMSLQRSGDKWLVDDVSIPPQRGQ